MAVITISREFGSGGETIARLVAEKLGFLLVNKKMIAEALAAYGIVEPELDIDEKFVEETDDVVKLQKEYNSALHEYLYDAAIRENLVILGRGGQILFQDFPPSLHIKINSPLKKRIIRIMQLYNLGEKAALKLIAEQERNRNKYLKQVFGKNLPKTDLYDLIINTGRISFEDAADMIAASFHIHGESREIVSKEDEYDLMHEEILLPKEEASFMHPSEEEFAKMLDFYQIKWEYESKTFPLEWDSEGNVTEAFAPDFYLPEQDLYLELTTQRQKLVWRKNKKLRRFRELYPDLNIKIMYNKDYKSLLRKFGRD